MLAKLLPQRRAEQRMDQAGLSMPDYLRLWEQFGYNGVQYVIPGGNIVEMTALMAQRDAIVAACIMARQLVFSQVRFAFQRWAAGKPGVLFGTSALALLEEPWPGATTADLLSRMEVDASLFGNSYWVKSEAGLTRLDPPLVRILTGDVEDPVTGQSFGRQLLGYMVEDKRHHTVATFAPDEVAHYAPMPDPQHEFRGLSWLGSLLPDVIADMDLSDFKHAFLANAATPNLVVQFTDPIGKDAMKKFVDQMEGRHTGPQAGFKTLYVGAGVDVKVVGSNFKDVAMESVQSQGETRIAAAAGVPPSLLGISEGLKGSALNAGNFASAQRNFADRIIRPNWGSACGALQTLVPAPPGARLWYDDRDVPFMKAAALDSAQVRQADAATMMSLINAGWEPATVRDAVMSGDWSVLEHTGLVSVQLLPITEAGAAEGTVNVLPAPVKLKGLGADETMGQGEEEPGEEE